MNARRGAFRLLMVVCLLAWGCAAYAALSGALHRLGEVGP